MEQIQVVVSVELQPGTTGLRVMQMFLKKLKYVRSQRDEQQMKKHCNFSFKIIYKRYASLRRIRKIL